MLNKQTLRKGVIVECEGKVLSKEETIALSENWNEKQEMFFRKMLKQGGKFSIKGRKFIITAPDKLYNSKGEEEVSTYTNNEE